MTDQETDLLQYATRTKDLDVATALHEAGHVLAYMYFGIPFEYVSVTEAFTAGSGLRICAWDHTVICLAGQVVETAVLVGSKEARPQIEDILSRGRAERAEYAEDPDLFDGVTPDFAAASTQWEDALPFAFALVHSSWELIQAIARAALDSDPLLREECHKVVVDTGLPLIDTGSLQAALKYWNKEFAAAGAIVPVTIQ